jgi:hypothetical protein
MTDFQQRREGRKQVRDLLLKFAFLKEVMRCSSTEAFCVAVNKALPTYSLNRRGLDQQVKSGLMSPKYQEALGRFCGFNWRDELWVSGSATQFREYLEKPQPPVHLLKAPEKPPVPSTIKGLATIQLFTGQYGKGTADIGFELSCGSASMHGVRVTIRRGVIEMDCGRATLRRESRKGFGQPYQIKGSHDLVTFNWSGGSTYRPTWDLEAAGYTIGNLEVPVDFATVENLTPGDGISISFGVWLKDLEPDNDTNNDQKSERGAEDISILAEHGNNIDLNAEALALVKRRILTCMAGSALTRDKNGFSIMTTHRIEFVERTKEEDRKA